MSATTWPGLICQRADGATGRFLGFALGAFEPAGAGRAHHRRDHPAAHRMARLCVERRDQQREGEDEDHRPAHGTRAAYGTHRHHVCAA